MTATSYPTTPAGVEIILANSGLNSGQVTRYWKDLWNGFRIALPTECSIAYNGNWPSCFTVWPARPGA